MRAFNIPIGSYFPGNSFLHRLDPRAKITLVFLFVFALFAMENLIGFILTSFLLMIVILSSELPGDWIIKSLRPLRYILVIAFLLHVIFTSSGRILFSIGSLTIFDQGLVNGLLTSLRLILLVSGTSLVTLTTTPIELTDGLERLLGPLKTVRIPTHELAMMMTLALRFIPILVMETERIMKAQMARGADYESGNMVRRAKSFVPLLIPLFVSILRRADELALAMDSRCYRGDINRTRMHQLKLNYADIMTFVICVLVLAGLVLAGRY